jgi:hypothetical protein
MWPSWLTVYAMVVMVHQIDTRSLALRVVELDTRRQRVSATAATVDSLLALYSDSIVYEDPNAGVVIRGKDTMRDGMMGYIGSIRHVTNLMTPRLTIGNSVVVVETSVRMETRDGDAWTTVRHHGIKVIELDAHGLVRRIVDYPR